MSKNKNTNKALRLLNGDRCSNCLFYSVGTNDEMNASFKCSNKTLNEDTESYICEEWALQTNTEKIKYYQHVIEMTK